MPQTALILAGGLGTRLRAAVGDRPKVLAPVLGRPFLSYLLDQLARAGVRHVVLCTGYLADQVEAAFGADYQGVALSYSRETAPLGTGGALRQAARQVRQPVVLVLNGDSLATVDLADLAAFHQARQAAASLVLVRVPDVGRYGAVETGLDERIARFTEKGTAAGPGWVNAGVYMVRRDLLLEQADQRPVSLERETFPHWVGRVPFYGFRSGAALLDIGTPESFARASAFLAAVGQAPSSQPAL